MLHIVTGPPAAGKSTFINDNRNTDDVVIDFDQIANVLAGATPGNHEHPQHIKTITRAARKAAIDAALQYAGEHNVWIIHSTPSPATLQRYEQQGARIHVIDPGKDIVMRRCKTERPATMLKVAAQWYAQQDRDESNAHMNNDNMRAPQRNNTKAAAKTTTQRGYDYQHKKVRKALLANMKQGTPCWWCGKPMYREPERNPDGKPLAADHINQGGAAKKQAATRLLHFNCNCQRKDGAKDHMRPALQAKPAPRDSLTFRWN